ncbi:hypothetical protein EII38_04900 [Streptococcus minor]|uniref:Uncharacterized protein n=1 Tax=Streptococcus minor TaxID=229549 RepID=A0A3P1VBG5_9STRE|nr:hypothetical protein [Streptococcus minor]RRD31562.1 hypothetical protein EII38_04900 [Streptococcus minor]
MILALFFTPLYLVGIEHGYATLQKDKTFLDTQVSASVFLFCCVSLTPLYLVGIEHGYATLQKDKTFLDT